MKNYNIEYYDKNAEKFFESTVGVDFKEEQERFLKYLKRGDKILDFGCGSGRDMKYFLEQGHRPVRGRPPAISDHGERVPDR